MLTLVLTYAGKSWIDDQCPASWSRRLVVGWARQRLESEVLVEVVDESGAIVFSEQVA